MLRRGSVFLVALVMMAALASGWAGSAREVTTPETRFTIWLTWKWKAEHAPLLLAAEKGFFAAEGLEVEIIEGDGVNATLARVAEGKGAVVAYGSAESAIRAIDRHMPLQVIAVYGREVPWAIVAKPGLKLQTPRDLEGRTLALAAEGTFEPILRAVAVKEGVDFQRINLVRLDEETKAARFLSGKVDLAAVYTNNQVPVWEKRTGGALSVLRLSDYGLKVPGSALISSRKVVTEQPASLKKLVRAINKGFAYTAEHVDEAAALMARRMPAPTDQNVLRTQIKMTLSLLPEVVSGEPSGRLPEAEWKQALFLMQQSGLITRRQPVWAYYNDMSK